MNGNSEAASLAQAAGWIADYMGLHSPAERSSDLRRRLNKVAPELGFASIDDLTTAMLAGGLSAAQLDYLVSALTVGETYFMRHRQAFEALTQTVVPDLLGGEPRSRPLRIWSVGCSNGAEPYSLSIVLSHAQSPSGEFAFEVLATDIDREALALARAGVFNSWALRDTPASVITECFDERSAGQFVLRQQYRQPVSFDYFNLVGQSVSPTPGQRGFDVIFCRNVLIYFSPEHRAMAAETLQGALVDGGYLFVAPAEVNTGLFPKLVPRELDGGFVFQKVTQATQTTAPGSTRKSGGRSPARRAVQQIARSPKVAQKPPVTRSTATARPTAAAQRPDPEDSDASNFFARMRLLADEGNIAAALELCEAAGTEMGLSASYHFLHASLLQELQRWEDASAALKRALYLDGDHVMASFVLGNIELRSGNARSARSRFAAVARTLDQLPADYLLPDSGGMSAAELRGALP
ncbi:MAG: protein-glutamate O-methyltransferase CheR [Actinomycetes bacterium]